MRLDAGPVVIAHLHSAIGDGDRVALAARTDVGGRGVLIARAASGGEIDSDPNLKDLITIKSGGINEHS